MVIDILTLFPDMFAGPFSTSMLKKAVDRGVCKINIHNLRDWATDKHKTVDGRPYGGGPGMVLRVDVVSNAIAQLDEENVAKKVLLSPQGAIFDQTMARELSGEKHLVLLAGHYEGFDQRIHENLVDMEVSIGEYVLTGGEIPAMVMVDAIVRLLPGVLEDEARELESFMDGKNFDYPVYTRPENFNGLPVPEVLLSGDHKKIIEWRAQKSAEKAQSRKR